MKRWPAVTLLVTLLVGLIGGLGVVQAAPAPFHRTVGTLSRLLMVRPHGPDEYTVNEDIRVRYDAQTPGILVSKRSVPLGDQGISVATALIPSWCGLNIEHLPVNYLTEQMAQSARLKAKVEAGQATSSLVRYRMGRCEVQTLSNGLESFVLLKQVAGTVVWPPRQMTVPQMAGPR